MKVLCKCCIGMLERVCSTLIIVSGVGRCFLEAELYF